MTDIKDGGPAFPEDVAVSPAGDVYPSYSGMTLRDYFAAKSLQGVMVCSPGSGPSELAKFSYKCADAMLAAREIGK